MIHRNNRMRGYFEGTKKNKIEAKCRLEGKK